jgi:hypothetical protein
MQSNPLASELECILMNPRAINNTVKRAACTDANREHKNDRSRGPGILGD